MPYPWREGDSLTAADLNAAIAFNTGVPGPTGEAGPAGPPGDTSWHLGDVTALGSRLTLAGGTLDAVASDWRAGLVTSLGANLTLTSGVLSATAASSGGGISEAPADSTFYCRFNNTWQHMPFSALTGSVTYAQLPSEVQQVPVAFPYVGKPTAGMVINIPMVMTMTVPAALAGTRVFAGTAPSGTPVFTLNRISGGSTTALGTVTFTGASTATLAGAGGALSAGDVLQLVAPASQDAALSDLGITILAARV